MALGIQRNEAKVSLWFGSYFYRTTFERGGNKLEGDKWINCIGGRAFGAPFRSACKTPVPVAQGSLLELR